MALVIVAFGMGAVLASLSAAANNTAALHDKTLAQWIALNLVADTRLNLQLPQSGTTEGDVKAFGNGDWHWQQDIVPVPAIPGLLEITVRVRRTGTSTGSSSSGGWSTSSSSSGASRSSGSSSLGGSNSFGGSSGLGGSGFGSSTGFGGSSGFGSSSGSGKLGLSSSSGSGLGKVSSGISQFASSGKDQNWLVTLIGFRGDAVGPANGEAPDWSYVASSGGSSSSGAASSSGAVQNPGTGVGASSGGSSLIGSSSGSGTFMPPPAGGSSGGS